MPHQPIKHTVKPSNYRRHIFDLFGKTFSLGAMARPDNNGACSLIWLQKLPSIEVLASWDASAYIFTPDVIYYYDKEEKKLSNIDLTNEQLQAFKDSFQEGVRIARLSSGELNTIAKITQHHHNGPYIDEALRYLVFKEEMDILIGLKEESFAELAQKQGIKYVHIPIEDWGGISIPDYNKIYDTVKQAIQDEHGVTIHCGAGDGRTGSALASLKLRERLEKTVRDNPSILEDEPRKTTSVYSFYYERDIECTPLVAEAINLLRDERYAAGEEYGAHSVESPTDVESLMSYENYLLGEMKNALASKQSSKDFKSYKEVYHSSKDPEVDSGDEQDENNDGYKL